MDLESNSWMCPVTSLIQQFSRRGVDHRAQPGSHALPKTVSPVATVRDYVLG